MTNGEYTRKFLLRTLDAYADVSVIPLAGKLRQELGCSSDEAMYCVQTALRSLIDEGGVVELRDGFVIRTIQSCGVA